ncbi:MAG TPA: sn-glycerol-3-phosphate ABC transporter ATP-binding protein UgpC [Rubrivivax sp.]|nr:sn-glycerol-3-phosphate ABC transporter ATP-binding protein UgpC [Rubrivivax sp.]
MAEVKLSGVGKAYGDVKILRGIDLHINDGEFMVFVGPSGCGKSTLLRTIAGLEDITEGELRIGNRVVNHVPPAERGIAMVFQSYALYPHMNLFDNMAFGLKLAKLPKAEIESAVNAAAKILHIEHLLQRKPKDLSGGQRQRVAIGRAIVRNPEVFLFDEPLSNLDTALRVKMRYEFAKLHEQFKTTMVYVTHDQTEAMTLADRIVVLNGGRIEQVGAPMVLYEHPESVFVAGFIGSPGMNFLAATIVDNGADHATVRLGGGELIRCEVNAAAASRGDSVTLGIRPEHLRPGVNDNALQTVVTFVESLGSLTYAYCRNAGSDDVITCAVEADRPLHSDESLSLGVPAGKAHLFDAGGRAFRRLAGAAAGQGHVA